MSVHAWAVVAIIGVATYLLRASFLVWLGQRPMPRLERALRYVPAAVLPALVVVSLRGGHGADADALLPRLVAAAAGGVVAWRTRSVLATMAVGMGALWAARWLLG